MYSVSVSRPTFNPELHWGKQMAHINKATGVFLLQIIDWLGDDRLLRFLFVLAVWGLFASIVYWLLFHLFKAIANRTRTDVDNILLRMVRTPIFVALVAFGLVNAVDQLQMGPELSLGVRRLYAVVLIVAVFYLAWRITKEMGLRWLKQHAVETENTVEDLLAPALNTVGPLVFFLLAFAFILEAVGVNIGLLLASIGAVGLIIGLAFQDILGNLFSGVYLMIDPPFRADDLIILPEGKIYRVDKVGLRMTQLYDMSNHALIFTPNSVLTKSSIANITKPTVDMKVAASIRSTMEADPARVKLLLKEILQSHRNILGRPSDKLATLRKRIDKTALLAGASSAKLTLALDALSAWRKQYAGGDQMHIELLELRKEMSRSLTDAYAVLKYIPSRPDTEQYLQTLRRILSGAGGVGKPDLSDTDRIHEIDTAWDGLASVLADEQLEPLRGPLASVEQLDMRRAALEHEIATQDEAAQDELDKLLAELVQVGKQVSEALVERNLSKEAARIALWVDNMAVVYTEMEMLDAVDGLNRELDGLVSWLRSMEEGGLNKQERDRIKTLVGAWGGMNMIENRRMAELRRRIMRWVEWKEEGVLPTREYGAMVAEWDRKLRQLSAKLVMAPSDEEELLDTHLDRTRQWINSVRFYEAFEDWKLPSAGFKGFGEYYYDYGMSYYIDDIKLENFARQGKVTGDLMMDIYEVFRSEGIEVPLPRSESVTRQYMSLLQSPTPIAEGNGTAPPAVQDKPTDPFLQESSLPQQ